MGTPLLRFKDELGVWYDVPAIRGYSAYQLAVKNGYTGTEKEWIDSITGVEGKSAYQVAVANGYSGTEEEWLNSLKAAGLNDIVKTYIDDRTTPVSVDLTILSTTWGDTVTIADEHITATKNVVMIPGSTITSEQLNALQKANCQDCGIQSNGSITFKVFGTVPTIDIPVKLIIGGNM